jgi:hypothetical protein
MTESREKVLDAVEQGKGARRTVSRKGFWNNAGMQGKGAGMTKSRERVLDAGEQRKDAGCWRDA